MLFDYIFDKVVILVYEINSLEGGLQEIVREDEDVILEVVVLTVLQVDVASFGLAHVELFDVGACHASLALVDRIFVLTACGSF